MKTERPNGFTDKILSFIGKNKQLFVGLTIGTLIMLPAGLYVNERNNSRQATIPNTAIETKTTPDTTHTQGLTSVAEQSTPSQNNNQPSAGSNNQQSAGSGKPTSTYTPSPAYKSYVPGVCSNTPIPYATSLMTATYLGDNQTKVIGGTDGYTKTCTADSNGSVLPSYTIAPIGKIIYIGTGGIDINTPPLTTQPPADELDRIKSSCSKQLAVNGSQDAYQFCVNLFVRYFNVSQ